MPPDSLKLPIQSDVFLHENLLGIKSTSDGGPHLDSASEPHEQWLIISGMSGPKAVEKTFRLLPNFIRKNICIIAIPFCQDKKIQSWSVWPEFFDVSGLSAEKGD